LPFPLPLSDEGLPVQSFNIILAKLESSQNYFLLFRGRAPRENLLSPFFDRECFRGDRPGFNSRGGPNEARGAGWKKSSFPLLPVLFSLIVTQGGFPFSLSIDANFSVGKLEVLSSP